MAKQQETERKVSLPYNTAIEQVILGAILMDSEAIHLAYPLLFEDAFAYHPHALIYKAIKDLYNDQQPIDILTVTEALKLNGNLDKAGGPYYLVEVTNRVGSSANLESHIRILLQKWTRRKLVHLCVSASQDASDESVDALQLLGTLQTQLIQVSEFLTVGSGERLPEIVDGILDRVLSGEQLVDFISIGIAPLKKMMMGFIPGELCILAGRPGSGKTTFAISLLCKLLNSMIPCAFVTYEMSSRQLVLKCLSNQAEINGEKLQQGKLEEYDRKLLGPISDKFRQAPLKLVEGKSMDATALRSKFITWKAQHGIKVIFIDYLQLIPNITSVKGKSTHDQLGETVRIIKMAAEEAGVAVVMLCQLSKETERNKWAKPNLSNLRDSGKIEDNADRVLFVWRPEYHGYDFVDYKGKEIDTRGKACILQAKFRHGKVGSCWLRTRLDISKFEALPGDIYESISEDLDFEEVETYTFKKDRSGFSDDVPF